MGLRSRRRAMGAIFVALVVAAGAGDGACQSVDPLNAAWTAVGPVGVASQSFGTVSGRVTAIRIDPADSSGNTVYVGTTGGGVWKSTNAAGAAANVSFKPLTDTLPVFNSESAEPSLSVGALSVNDGVVLAGTGDPNDATDSYYGEGILRSADGGLTWTLVQESHDGVAGNHTFAGLAAAGFAWSTLTPGLVVAAMSQSVEGVVVNAPDATYSVMGLYYSTDAGVTWQMATIQDGTQIVQQPLPGGAPGNAATAVVWDQARAMFYAAVRFHGYYESANGVTWTRMTTQPGVGMSLTACPTNPGGAGSSNCPVFRGALAVNAATGDVFALTVDTSNLDQGIWQNACALSGSACTGADGFATRIGSAALEIGSGSTAISQGDYNLTLAATANGTDTLLFAGATDLYRCSLAAGCVWRNTTNAINGCAAPAMVSPAQHAVAALAGGGTAGTPLVFVGNDGGLWRSVDGVNQQQTPCSTDDKNHFQNLNSGLGSLAEVVSLAQDPTVAGTLLVGLGANGTAGTGAAQTAAAWAQLAAGEGGYVAIDPANPANWYVSTAAGVSLGFCGKGSGCGAADFAGTPTIGAAQVDGDSSLIHEPLLLDPALTSNVLIGTCRVWRGAVQSGGGWPGSNEISTVLGAGTQGVCGPASGMVRSLAAGGPASGATAVQDAGSTVLYAGMAGSLDGGGAYGGHVFVNSAGGSAGAGSAWTDAAKAMVTNDTADAGVFNPGGFDVSAVVVDAHDATGKTVYATVMGFAGNGTNAPHVYRSVNGGASWTNISSNLPNVPANALIVDPNSANTVYVGTDAGVYVTTAVTNCVSANCWSLYGTGLPNAPVTQLAAAAGIATGDGRLGELRAGTYGRGVWEIPLLTAAAASAPAMTLNPVSLSFAAQAVGSASAGQTVTVTNSGSALLNVSQIVTSGDFTETDNCVGASGGIAVGGTCTVTVSFLPTATGARTGILTIYGNVPGGQATATLSGTGAQAAAILLSPVAVAFPATTVGAASTAVNLTISNTGGVAATLATPVATGDFSITANTCGTSLAPGVGCTVEVEFVPTASGTRNGTFSVTDSVGTQTAALSGTGVAPATDALTPLSLVFAAQQLNTTSATQQVTLTNAGGAALTGIAVQVTGDFTMVNGCGSSLNGQSSCALVVAYVPKSVGAETGQLTVTDAYRTQTVTLMGTGLAPPGVSLSPSGPVAFAATGVGLDSGLQMVTLTNNGGVSMAIQGVVLAGDFAIVAGTNTCGTTLAAGGTCSMEVVFAPTAAGVRMGSLTVTDNAPTSPQVLTLTGTGVDFTLTASGATTQTIPAGASAVYPLLLSSLSGLQGTVAMSCTGAPANSTCIVNPVSGALGGTETMTVTLATDVAELRLPGTPWRNPSVGIWMAGLLPLGLIGLGAGRRGRRTLMAVAMLACGIWMTGCTASRMIPLSDTSGGGSTVVTPSGTYNLVVTATNAGLTRTVPLTLVVQ